MLISVRASIKFIVIFAVALLLIVGILSMTYKPIYKVSVDDEFLGYIESKRNLQSRINKYIDGEGQNVAFIQIENLPEYKLCLLKKDIVTSDDEIFNKITRR